MSRQERNGMTPEWRSKIEQRFIDFVNRHVKPVDKVMGDASNIHEATLDVDQLPSLVPVNCLRLSRMVINETADSERREEPHPEPYDEYAAHISHTGAFGTATSVYFCNVDGFQLSNPNAHTGLVSADHDEIWPIVRSLIEHEAQGRFSKSE
jgi:hypothetical protein